jgi:hypothetical protein
VRVPRILEDHGDDTDDMNYEAVFYRSFFTLAILFFALSGIAAAQIPVQVDFGVRGGVLLNNSFQANQLCSSAGCTLASHSFASEGLRGTVGPTVGVLLHNRFGIRFEAVHRRFGYQVKSDTANGFVTQHFVETVRGHLWEYPLIATYRFGHGPSPYVGGGLSVGANGRSTTTSEGTSQVGSAPATTFFDQRTNELFGVPTGYYIVGGLDKRVSHFSIRPEFRYTHFPSGVSSAETILTPNQLEFVVGISIYPFRIQK